MQAQHAETRVKVENACQSCRARKVRCLPDSQTGRCQNCQRSGSRCEWAPRIPRIRKERLNSKARIAALESKLEQLVSELPDPSLHPSAGAYSSPSLHQSAASAPPRAVDEDPLRRKKTVLNDADALADTLSQHGVSLADAEQYLSIFGKMTLYFPFVVFPADSTLSSLSEKSPVRLLAAVTAASSSNKTLQTSLEHTLRSTLLYRILSQGEKSLDLLAALLIYLVWYQFYCVPGKDAFTQFLQIAIGMCNDLGLHLTPKEAAEFKIGLELNHSREAQEFGTGDSEFFSPDARRLLLGCYYLSCHASMIRRKPNNMQFTEYMASCAASLASANEYLTDSAIPSIIQLQHMTDCYHEKVGKARTVDHTPASVTKARNDLIEIQAQMRAQRSSIPGILHQSTFIDLALHMASIHVHEMDLINPFVDKTLSLRSTNISAPLNAEIRLEIISLCLQGAKDFFRSFLTIPPSELRYLSMVQWGPLILATMVLYKLSIGLASVPEWDPEIARSSVPLETYLETCCQLMSNANYTGVTKEWLHGDDLFSVMAPIWSNVRDSYLSLRRKPWKEAVADQGKVHATHFPRPSPLGSDISSHGAPRHPCPAFPFWTRNDFS